MANPKVTRLCRLCGETREHYTRRNGRTISPCAECQIVKAKARQDAIRDDPAALDHQRDEWNRIKKRQRMIYRGEIGVATADPETAPDTWMSTRREMRRRRSAALAAAVSEAREQEQADDGAPAAEETPPSPPRRRRRRGAQPTSMESGLD